MPERPVRNNMRPLLQGAAPPDGCAGACVVPLVSVWSAVADEDGHYSFSMAP
jgi:hypothetical protein